MKKISYLLLITLSLGLGSGSAAGQSDRSDDVAAILARMPATNQPAFNEAMQTMGSLDKGALQRMASMLKPAGQGDNTAVEYALNGFAGYVMQPGREAWRSRCVEAYGYALASVTDAAGKQFLIRQLELAGKDDAIPFLTPFLNDDTLAHPAAQALATIGTPAARQALSGALDHATAATRRALVQALGDCRATEAAARIAPMAGSNDTLLRKASLYALANIGSPTSAAVLREAASRANYRYSADNATSDYLLFLLRLIDSGETAKARKLIHNLMKNTGRDDQRVIHAAAQNLTLQLPYPAAPAANTLTAQEKKEGFRLLFNGRNLDNWVGNRQGYLVENGEIVVNPGKGSGGNLYTKGEYANFVFRFQFQLTPGANNGIGIRTPTEGDAAYVGMEIQVLDNTADMYKDLHPYQYHGSVYGVIPAKHGYLKPLGQWNSEEIRAVGPMIRVTLNGHVIVDGNINEASKDGTADHKAHPGLTNTTGHIGFLGHGSVVRFRDVRVKSIDQSRN